MSYTPGQKASIEHVDGPLLISAGAGSGKTFTLTRRIAWALTPGSAGEGRAWIDDIDQVLAITFTEKAAREIKARVRSTLRQNGLVEQALKVDAAWISTIHGMCSRILREHALDLGIDPAFSIVKDQERSDLVDACIDEAIGRKNDLLDDRRYGGLFEEYRARGSENSVREMLSVLLDTASGLMDGLDAFTFGPEPVGAARLAFELKTAYEDLGAVVNACLSEARKPGKTLQEAQACCEHAVDELHRLVESGCDHRTLADAFGSFGNPAKRGSEDYKQAVDELRRARARVAGECAAAFAWKSARSLMELARDVEGSYQRRLQDRGAMDMDGLLRTTLRALRTNPDVARAFSDRFKLVMVDEFQDTNQLQIDMISCLVGENDQRLCTVGDSQQSIYAFRGADLSVYEEHKRRMRSSRVGALDVRLDANFRSNKAVLDFAECVFRQDHVFGAGFLHLDAGRDESRVKTPYRGSAPRIDLVDVRGEKGVNAEDRAKFVADEIARRFAVLRDEGHEPRDMVILLGTMARSVRYAEALRSQGFDCVITGGSTFTSFPEVRTVGLLLNVLANPHDTRSLFAVLTSDLFGLSADDLVDLSTRVDERGARRRRSLDAGLRSVGASGQGGPCALCAARSLKSAWADMRWEAPSRVVEGVLRDCGILARYEAEGAEGVSKAANVLKAVRLVRDFESEGAGMAQVASSFERFVAECGKEKPGALTTKDKNYVQIMTVHASKGLEFPIVALADCWKPSSRETAGCLLAKHARGTVFCSLKPSRPVGASEGAERQYEVEDASIPLYERMRNEPSSFVYRELLKRFIAHEALEEKRRCFYVAVTRASEALIVAFADEKAPIVEDVRSALCGDDPFPEQDALLDYGGDEPARYRRTFVTVQDRDAARDDSSRGESPAVFLTPVRGGAPKLKAAVWEPSRDGLCSYSSLSSQPALPRSSRLLGAQDGIGEVGESAEGACARCEAALPSAVVEREGWDEIFERLAEDADRATDLGSAFHLLAQSSVDRRKAGERLSPPGEERIEAACGQCKVTRDQSARLRRALARWFESDVANMAADRVDLFAELPFCLAVDRPGAPPLFLEGEIDLLCTDGPDEEALVIDYKTGGRRDDDPGALATKHELQARCYALAVLRRGFPSVRLAFVRVEQDDGTGQPQTIWYHFASDAIPELEETVRNAYGASIR